MRRAVQAAGHYDHVGSDTVGIAEFTSGHECRDAAAQRPSAVTPAMITMGDSIFHAASCQRCHGPDAKGATNGPNLTGPTFLHIKGTGSYNDFLNVIMSGVPADSIKDPSHRQPMRPRGGGQTPLTDDQVKAVAAYVYSLSHKS